MKAMGAGAAFVSLSGCSSVKGGAVAEAGEECPNILYIFTDDQSRRSVSCYPEAHDWVKTPNIDALAEQGVRFTHCYTGAWCMPSRAMALTGRLVHGIQTLRMVKPYPNSKYDPKKCRFWPSDFRKKGYFTGLVGKWHLGSDFGHGRDWDWSVVWDRTIKRNNYRYYNNQKVRINGGDPVDLGGYSTDRYTDYAEEFISQHGKDSGKPWFLWLCYGAVHHPYHNADRHDDEYRGEEYDVDVPEDIYPPRPGKSSHMQKIDYWKNGPDGPIKKKRGGILHEHVQQYNRSVMALDDAVARLVKILKKTGQLDNTLIVFTSDQGFAWGQHGFAHKYAPYDANICAPLIFRWPSQVPQGTVCREPVNGADIVRSFYSAAGLETPWDFHGRDIFPLVKNPETKLGSPMLMACTGAIYGREIAEHLENNNAQLSGGVPWWVMLRDGKYKYIRFLSNPSEEELYDLEKDPKELTNLAGNPEHIDLLRALRQKTVDAIAKDDKAFAQNLPPLRAQ